MNMEKLELEVVHVDKKEVWEIGTIVTTKVGSKNWYVVQFPAGRMAFKKLKVAKKWQEMLRK